MDTFIKAAITLIPQIPESQKLEGKAVSTEPILYKHLTKLLALLVIIPGHPEYGPFYLVEGLFKSIALYEGWTSESAYLPLVYIQLLRLLNTYAQTKLPYHIVGVESNDDLYGGADDYMEELKQKFGTVLDKIISEIATLGANENTKVKQTEMMLELINTLTGVMILDDSSVKFISRMINKTFENRDALSPAMKVYLKNTIKYVVKTATEGSETGNLQSGNNLSEDLQKRIQALRSLEV